MPTLLRGTQMGIEVQADENTPATIEAADLLAEAFDPKNEVRVNRTQRKGLRGSISPRPNLHGSRLATMSGGCELAGGSASTAPVFGDIFQAGGFTQTAAYRVTLDDATGFAAGYRIGNNATYASATVVGIIAAIDGLDLYVIPTLGNWAGLADASTLHVYSRALASTASDTTDGATVACGWAWLPFTETNTDPGKFVTMQRRMARAVGSEFFELVSGKCDFRVMLEQDNPAQIMFDMTGIPRQESDGDPQVVASALTAPTVPAPFPCRGVVFSINDTYTPPVLTSLAININNTVTARPTFTASDIEDSGNVAPRITARNPTFVTNPEYIVASDYNWHARSLSGDTNPLVVQHSSLDHANGMFVAIAEAVQLDQDVSPGDRDGIVSQDMTFKCTGELDNEVYFAQLFAV